MFTMINLDVTVDEAGRWFAGGFILVVVLRGRGAIHVQTVKRFSCWPFHGDDLTPTLIYWRWEDLQRSSGWIT